MRRETGVRALRSLFEQLLLDVRYELPDKTDGTRRLTVDLDFVHYHLGDAEGGAPRLGRADDDSEPKRETA